MQDSQIPTPVTTKIGEIRSFPSPQGPRFFGVMASQFGGASFDARTTAEQAETDVRNCFAGTPTPYVKHGETPWPRSWYGRLAKRVKWWWVNRGRA
jgi:hypothetical protein